MSLKGNPAEDLYESAGLADAPTVELDPEDTVVAIIDPHFRSGDNCCTSVLCPLRG
jgi:hypothetical protein